MFEEGQKGERGPIKSLKARLGRLIDTGGRGNGKNTTYRNDAVLDGTTGGKKGLKTCKAYTQENWGTLKGTSIGGTTKG